MKNYLILLCLVLGAHSQSDNDNNDDSGGNTAGEIIGTIIGLLIIVAIIICCCYICYRCYGQQQHQDSSRHVDYVPNHQSTGRRVDYVPNHQSTGRRVDYVPKHKSRGRRVHYVPKHIAYQTQPRRSAGGNVGDPASQAIPQSQVTSHPSSQYQHAATLSGCMDDPPTYHQATITNKTVTFPEEDSRHTDPPTYQQADIGASRHVKPPPDRQIDNPSVIIIHRRPKQEVSVPPSDEEPHLQATETTVEPTGEATTQPEAAPESHDLDISGGHTDDSRGHQYSESVSLQLDSVVPEDQFESQLETFYVTT